MEIGLGEIVMIGILAVLLLEPKDLPRIAKKSARAYVGLRGFMKTNWLALAEGEASEDGAHKPAAKS
ncbi:MAG: hypothetical protein IJG43_06015 [Acidaminococcaceae bacterium]|nr:hypothetical protein [Acidaminococcaceae bacterium]